MPGYEWLYVLSGEMRLILGEHDITMRAGEVAEFDTRLPHWFGPAGDEPVEILSVHGSHGQRMHVRAAPAAQARDRLRQGPSVNSERFRGSVVSRRGTSTTAARIAVPCVADAADRQELLTALTTEHFTIRPCDQPGPRLLPAGFAGDQGEPLPALRPRRRPRRTRTTRAASHGSEPDPPVRSCAIRAVPAATPEPAEEGAEHEPCLGSERDVRRDADDDAERQAKHRSERDRGSEAQRITAATEVTNVRANAAPKMRAVRCSAGEAVGI